MAVDMPRGFRRETFIALRARRQAHAIARGVLNPHVDIAAVPCRACGADVRIDPHHLSASTTCPACGASVLLPANYLAEADEDAAGDDVRHVPYEPRPLPAPQGLSTLQCLVMSALIAIAFFAMVLLGMTLFAS